MSIDPKSYREIIDQMAAHGIFFPSDDELQVYPNNGTWQRFKPVDSRFKRGKEGWYRIFEVRLSNGKIVYNGKYGVAGEAYLIEHDKRGWTSAEWKEIQEKQKEVNSALEAIDQERRERCRKKAEALWNNPQTQDSIAANHPYVVKKKIRPLGARQLGNQLLIPLMKFDQEGKTKLVSLQVICEAETDDGGKLISKRFLTGSETKGSWAALGKLNSETRRIYICEGWATACSIYEATQQTTIVAFSAGNLVPVGEAFRNKFPDAQLCFAADNDCHYHTRLKAEVQKRFGVELKIAASRAAARLQYIETPKGQAEICAYWSKRDGELCLQYQEKLPGQKSFSRRTLLNTGVAKAKAAAAAVKGTYCVPKFSGKTEGTDFNDLHNEEGIEVVRQQIAMSSALTAKVSERGRKASKEEQTSAFSANIRLLGERYVAIDNTDTVWDLQYRRITKISVLKQWYGTKLVSEWLRNEYQNRRLIQPDQLIFEPDPTKIPEGSISMFEGWPIKPDPGGDCTLMVNHLMSICGENTEVFDWVVRWLAYPLQHPGAKMNSALLVYGEREGTGKSMFFNAVAKIYGKYACSVNQTMIQSDFNGWVSQKLFVVCEEVVTNQDKRTLKGMLKNLVTNDTHTINEKGLPARFEDNKTNFVFLSNEQQPVILDPKDRRYMSIRFEQYNPPEYFVALAKEIENGGLEAIYQYLLNVDLGGFKPSTRILETEAHSELKSLGSNNSIRFLKEWTEGDTPFPCCAAVAWHLYDAYSIWCKCSGERPVNRENFLSFCTHRLDKIRTRVKLYAGPQRNALYPEFVTLMRYVYWPRNEGSAEYLPKDKDRFASEVLGFQKALFEAKEKFKNYELV